MKFRPDLTAHLLGSLTLLVLFGVPSEASERAEGSSLPSEAVRSRATFPGQVFSIGSSSRTMTVGDFNGDGFKDIAVVNRGEYDSGGSFHNPDLSVLFGLGDGTFIPQAKLDLGNAPVSVVTGDFNGDGTDDLAVGTAAAGQALIFLAHRDQTFSGPVAYPGGSGVAPLGGAAAIGDWNGDGRKDLVVAIGSGELSVLLGSGDGSFTQGARFVAGTRIGWIVAADLNRDGALDLASVNRPDYQNNQPGDLSVSLGAGDGTFGPGHHFEAGGSPIYLAVADFDGDAIPDLATAIASTRQVLILRGAGDGTFATPVPFEVGSYGSSILLAEDFNGDGRPDIAVAGDYPEISVLVNSGTGGFSLAARVVAYRPKFLVAADFNRDGRPDLAADYDYLGRPGDLQVFPGNGDGTFASLLRLDLESRAGSVAPGDFNRDGRQDLAIGGGCLVPGTNWYRSTVTILLARGDGTFSTDRTLETGLGIARIAAGDFNGDGLTDLAVASMFSDEIWILLGDPFGSFVPLLPFRSTSLPSTLIVGDFDGDGRQDLAVLNRCTDYYRCGRGAGRIALFSGRGDGTFDLRQTVSTGDDPSDMVSGDLNSDALIDLAVASWGQVVVHLGGPGGILGPGTPIALGDFYPFSIAMGDLNSDGRQDLVASSPLTFLPGKGNGAFDAPIDFSLTLGGLVIGDFDLDGHDDVAGTGFFYSHLFRGNGSDSLEPRASFITFGDASDVGVASDFDGDGRLDLALAQSQRVSVLLNIGPSGDVDQDGVNDGLDSCVDRDGDGFGNPGFRGNVCPLDNCPFAANPDQVDSDDDGKGDACDPCVFEPGEDLDGDGICGAADNCPGVISQNTLDTDGDGIGDVCDVCPAASNPDQADANQDGSGDACQPVVILSDIREDGGDVLEVSVDARDPQDDPLFGSIEFFDPDAFVMPNVLEAPDVCSAARFGSGPGEGILYVNFDGQPILVDLSLSGMCGSSQPVFWFASGKCAHPDSAFDSSFQIALPNATMPISICVALFPSYDGSFDLTVLGFDEQAATVSLGESLALSLPIDSGLPPISDISSLRSGTRYRMLITVGDGTTRAARAERRFLYRGERTMRIDFPTGDSDGDGFTDASDSCTDSDRDGFGNPGFPANTCPPDNCPLRRNSEQVETDGDGVGDMCDNCPETINPMQEDSDRDSEGNACDPCPQDAQGDLDGDGVCREIDNCPAADNPGQEDTNADGSGDSCQPSLILVGVAQHGGDALEVIVSARDPQNDSLTGSVEITTLRPITLPDVLFTSDCGQGFLPEGVRGEGVGFTYGFVGTPFLFDLDTYMGCYDFLPDYLIARGTCSKPTSSFENAISLADFTPPAGVCIYRVGSSKAGIDLRILEFDSATFTATIIQPVSVLRDELDSLLRAQIDISMLEAGQTYRLVITVTDGTTLPVSAESTFVPHGESKLVFAFPNSLPQARVTAAATTVECVNSSGGAVVLDASASTDPDSTPGTNDDIVAFEWFENYGLPTQSYLGSGAILDAQLSLGSHTIGLRVTDSEGATSAAGTVVTVRDTIPPVLHCPATASAECAGLDGSPVSLFATATDMCGGVTITSSRGGADATGTYPPGDTQVSFMATDASGNPASCVTDVTVRDTTPPVIAVTVEPASLWPPNHRLVPVRVVWRVGDVCDPSTAVRLSSVTSNEPDDAQGDGDGGTTGDIDGAGVGTPDGEILMRAERSGSGTGRTYEIQYAAIDASGNSTSALALVAVPHDEGGGPEPLIMKIESGSSPRLTHIYWGAVQGAQAYDVITGDVAQIASMGTHISLGHVRVLARGLPSTSYSEGTSETMPPAGHALFYLVQYQDAQGASGFGTESAPLPEEPATCDGGCPGQDTSSPTGDAPP